MLYFLAMEKLLSITQNFKGLEQLKQSRKNKVGDLTLPHFKTYSKVHNQKSVALSQDKHIDQWNRIDSPEINHHIFGQLIFDMSARIIQWIKNSLFNKGYCKNWIFIRIFFKILFSIKVYIKYYFILVSVEQCRGQTTI